MAEAATTTTSAPAPAPGAGRVTRDLFDLTGRVAIVTGAASGLGAAIAAGLAAFGADVALVDLRAAGLRETQAQVEGAGRRALPLECDVSRAEQVTTAVEGTLA